MDRRHFLGAAAGAAAGATVAGCDVDRGGHPKPKARASRRAREAAERALPGSPDWRIRSFGPAAAVQGYADRVSVLPGEEFGLYVSTTAPGFRVSAYRVGWYGGAQARLVWRSGRVGGVRQGAPEVIAGTRTVVAGWRRSLTIGTTGWPEGAYLLRLDADDGHQRYVPIVVRSRRARGRTLLMHAAATWQAYNTWGGFSLYQGQDGAYGTRSLAVSFDRPYAGNGAEKFLVYERAAVVLAERLGIPLAYTTGVDVALDPAVLDGRRPRSRSAMTSTGRRSSGSTSRGRGTREPIWPSSARTPVSAGSGSRRGRAGRSRARWSATRPPIATIPIWSATAATWRPPTSGCPRRPIPSRR